MWPIYEIKNVHDNLHGKNINSLSDIPNVNYFCSTFVTPFCYRAGDQPNGQLIGFNTPYDKSTQSTINSGNLRFAHVPAQDCNLLIQAFPSDNAVCQTEASADIQTFVDKI